MKFISINHKNESKRETKKMEFGLFKKMNSIRSIGKMKRQRIE